MWRWPRRCSELCPHPHVPVRVSNADRPDDSLPRFFVLTFAITWPAFSGVAALSAGFAPSFAFLRLPLLILGIVSPALTAVWLTARSGGAAAVRDLLIRMFQWRVGWRWYLFAVGYMAAVKLAVALMHRIGTGEWPRFGPAGWYLIVGGTVLSTVVGGQAGEEIGWRGFALPRLATRFGLGGGAVILGVIWAWWHLPLFFVVGADTFRQSFPIYMLQVTAISVAIAWLYAGTGGSLLLTMLMHAAINHSKNIVPSGAAGATGSFTLSGSAVSWLTLVALWAVAIYLLFRMRGSQTRRNSIAASGVYR